MATLRVSVAGFTACSYFQRARTALLGMSALVPSMQVEVHEHPSGDDFKAWWAAYRTVRCRVSARGVHALPRAARSPSRRVAEQRGATRATRSHRLPSYARANRRDAADGLRPSPRAPS